MLKSFSALLLLLSMAFSISLDPALAQEQEEGKLEEFESSVDKDSKKKKKEKEEEEDEDSKGSFLGNLCGAVVLRLTPAILFGSSLEDTLVYAGSFWAPRFSDYPYAHPNEGQYSSRIGKWGALKFSSHYFRDDSDLHGIGIRGRLSPASFLNIDINFTGLKEELSSGNDHLLFYDVVVNYYRVRLNRWTLWYGFGFKAMKGNEAHYGGSFNLGTEIYPIRPISLYFNVNEGFVGESSLSELLLRLSIHLQRSMIFAGYQKLSTDAETIDGFIGGIGVHF